MQEKVAHLIQDLAAYDEQSRKPFPRKDCRKITGGDSDKELDLVGDLNTYDMTISGPISWGDKVMEWSNEKIDRILKYTAKPFFDQYPQYKPLEPLVSDTNTPDLCADLQLHEEMRLVLRQLLTQILADRHR